MAIHYDKRDIQTANGEPVFAVTFFCRNEHQRKALIVRSEELPAPRAWVPFDPPEEWPSDRAAKWALPESGTTEPNTGTASPPNCDGNNSAGQYIAGAQLDNALQAEGDGCGIGLCPSRDEA